MKIVQISYSYISNKEVAMAVESVNHPIK